MVFEKLLARVLENAIGAYVEDFEREQLDVGILRGEVVLRHVLASCSLSCSAPRCADKAPVLAGISPSSAALSTRCSSRST